MAEHVETRPKACEGLTTKKTVGCGTIYITINRYEEGPPVEVFIRIGKSGQCASCQNQALGRVISIGLQNGVPAELYIHTLLGLKCPSPNSYPEGEETSSCADAVARVFQEYINEHN